MKKPAPKTQSISLAPVKKAPTPRKYPRADVGTKAKLRVPGNRHARLEATLPAGNVSVGGVFFESTFFLKVGERVEVELQLEPRQPAIRAIGTVIRVEHLTEGAPGKSGFAVKFDEYPNGSDVALAKYFLAPRLREFVAEFARAQRQRPSPQQLEESVNLLAAWELSKTEATNLDLWALGEPKGR